MNEKNQVEQDKAALRSAWDDLIAQLQDARDIIDSPDRFAHRFLKPKTPVRRLWLTGQDIMTAGIAGAAASGVLTMSAIRAPSPSLDSSATSSNACISTPLLNAQDRPPAKKYSVLRNRKLRAGDVRT